MYVRMEMYGGNFIKLIIPIILASLSLGGFLTPNKSLVEAKQNDATRETVVYHEDFENIVGEIYQDTKFWGNGMSIVENAGNHSLLYTYDGGATQIGGINTHQTGLTGNDLFENGKLYRVEFDALVTSVADNATVQFDFNIEGLWTSFKVGKTTAYKTESSNGTVRNVQYVDGQVSATFTCSAGGHYFEIFVANMASGDSFKIDNFKVVCLDDVYSTDNYGTIAGSSQQDHYYVADGTLEPATAASGQKYLHFYGTSNTVDTWEAMFFNHLPLTYTAGKNYRNVIKFLEAPTTTEMYINMVGNWAGHTTFTINPVTGEVTHDSGLETCDITWSDNTLVIDFYCSTTLPEQQIRFVSKSVAGTVSDFKIAEFTVYDLDLLTAKAFAKDLLDKTANTT